MTKESPKGRIEEVVEEIRSKENVQSISKPSASPNLWQIHTDQGPTTLYFHYSKWFYETERSATYFQASKNVTENADRPLYHVFLGPGDDSIRFVSHKELFGGEFELNLSHNNGADWRLNRNEGDNARLLDEAPTELPI